MMMFEWIMVSIVALGVWTAFSIWWFLLHFGNMNRRGKWYDVIMLLPALVALYLLGLFRK
jgi:hypothetical protein